MKFPYPQTITSLARQHTVCIIVPLISSRLLTACFSLVSETHHALLPPPQHGSMRCGSPLCYSHTYPLQSASAPLRYAQKRIFDCYGWHPPDIGTQAWLIVPNYHPRTKIHRQYVALQTTLGVVRCGSPAVPALLDYTHLRCDVFLDMVDIAPVIFRSSI